MTDLAGTMPRTAIVAVLVTAAVVLAVTILMLARRKAAPPVVSRPVLTRAEISFHRVLSEAVRAIGGLKVFPQMAMSAFVQPRPGLDEARHLATFRSFSQKRPDFVLVDAEWHVRLIVELDDSSHDAGRDAERDRLTRAAGIPTVRFAGGRRSVDEVRTTIEAALRAR